MNVKLNRLLEIVTIGVTNVSHKLGVYTQNEDKNTLRSRKMTTWLLFVI